MLSRIASAISLFLAFFDPQSSFGTDYVSFNPSACETEPDGKLTIRLVTGVAFQFPADHLVPIVNLKGPDVPNFDTLGCPENPVIVLGTYIGSNGLNLGEYNEEGLFVWSGPSIEFISIGATNRPPILQLSDLKAFARNRESGGLCEEFDGDLLRCFPDKAGEAPIGYLSVRDGKYEEFEGLPIGGSCIRRIGGKDYRCTLYYQLEPGLAVSWRLNTINSSEDQIIGIDRKIRRKILAMRAEKYDYIEVYRDDSK